MTTQTWPLVEPDVAAALARYPFPLDELAAGRIAAVVIRGAYPRAACQRLIDRLVQRELLYDPDLPIPEKFQAAAIPEGYYREGKQARGAATWDNAVATGKSRIDVGTSLGYRGSDKDEFLRHSRQTHELFATLFDDRDNPVQLIYDRLQELSRDKKVVTAYEPDGQLYGPAIIRAHYGGYTYKPHFDSVRLREKRSDYAVHDFEHQFAGVLVLQNSQAAGKAAQCVLHHCLWHPEIDPHLKDGSFHRYAEQMQIDNVEVRLEPGDLYFFNTRCIHEVPGVPGDLPRIVLATFIGYSRDREEIYVWS